jgi:hypothetical protein
MAIYTAYRYAHDPKDGYNTPPRLTFRFQPHVLTKDVTEFSSPSGRGRGA